MTKLVIATLAGLVAGLSAGTQAPAADSPRERVAVVVDVSGPGAEARIATAEATARARGATLRAPRSLHDQLSVTSLLAAQGYTTIIGFGLEEFASIEPLPDSVRYVSGRSNTVSRP
jgi:hypothetical protein